MNKVNNYLEKIVAEIKRQMRFNKMMDDGEKLIKLSSKLFGYKKDDIAGKTSKRKIVYIRSMIMDILIENNDCVLKEYGLIFNKDHTMVLHYKKIFDEQIKYKDFKSDYEKLKTAYLD